MKLLHHMSVYFYINSGENRYNKTNSRNRNQHKGLTTILLKSKMRNWNEDSRMTGKKR